MGREDTGNSPARLRYQSLQGRLFLDGVYAVDSPHGTRPRIRWVRAPTSAQLTQLAHTIARRVGRLLEREGLLERDTQQLEAFQRSGICRHRWFQQRDGVSPAR